jgi:hypothetical protein
MIACAIGYFVSQAVGETAAMYAGSLAGQLLVRSFVKGAVLGLMTADPLEQILFNVQANPTNAGDCRITNIM